MTEAKQLSVANAATAKIERVVIHNDLSVLTEAERVAYYKSVCDSLGLNWMTQPFSYIVLNGKLTLYANKGCADQLRARKNISIKITAREKIGDVYVVTAQARDASGREDESTGAVAIGAGLKGDALANAYLKCECVPLEYEMLTRDGFKHALELEVGELVAAMDPETQQVHWVPLEGVSVYPEQRVTAFGNAYVEFEITSGHKWVTETANGVRSLKPFEDIKGGTSLILAGANRDEDSLLTPKEAATLGWIVTDGTIKSYKGELYRASICQGKRENFEHIEWALSELGGVTRGVTDNRERGWLDQHWWYLSKTQTQALFRKAGYTSKDDLPRIAAKLGYSARESMLDAMMRADGDKRGTFGKCDKAVVEAFQVLCALNGYLTSRMRTRMFEGSNRPFHYQRKLSYSRVNFNNLEEQGSRETSVWCPTTKYGTWICRTDHGQAMVTGNTKAKRRVTLSICGLGFLDESEVDSIADAKRVDVHPETGEIKNVTPPKAQAPVNEPHASTDPGEYVVDFGKFKGAPIKNINPDDLMSYVSFLESSAKESGKPIGGRVKAFIDAVGAYLEMLNGFEEYKGEDVPF